ncbi:MAG: hypothetical protein K1X67_13885 [Fimbriimonadaceae bacterium]|nr:hypothetical protein [Fimbriimonadaceae bacterium]
MKKAFLLAAMGLFASQAFGQLIVGNDQSGTATIWNVDVNTGVATPLYAASTSNAKPWGMAADNVNNILYWNNGGNLYSATYASLLSGIPVINTVAMTYLGNNVNFVGLGYNPTTGRLLGTRNIATESVYEIDPATGIATILHAHPTTFDFGGLDYYPGDGQLYGLSDTAPAGNVRGLYRIESDVSQVFLSGYPGAETDIDGLAVGNGRAYYVTDGPNTTQALFYVYDLAGNQVGTLPSPFTGSGTFCAAAWAPGLSASQATVDGRVILNDYIPNAQGRSVMFEIIQNGNVVQTENVVLGADGAYSFTTSLTGNAAVTAKASHWLRQQSSAISLNAGSTSTVSFSLINGDADGDNEVGIGDYARLSASYNSSLGDILFDAEADFNGDDSVDIADYAILSANYGLGGD